MLLLRTVMLATVGMERRPLTNSLVTPILAAGGHASLTPPFIFMGIGVVLVIGGIIAMREARRGQNIDAEFSLGGCLCIIIGIVLIGVTIAIIHAVTHGEG